MERFSEHMRSFPGQENTTIVSASSTRAISAAEWEARKCAKCNGHATHLRNMMAHEKLLCDAHAAYYKRKCRELPADMWFCRRLQEQEQPAFEVMDIEPSSKEQYDAQARQWNAGFERMMNRK